MKNISREIQLALISFYEMTREQDELSSEKIREQKKAVCLIMACKDIEKIIDRYYSKKP